MTGKAMLAKLHRLYREARAEQATHKRKWGACLSSCETLQRLGVLEEVIEALGGRLPRE